MPRDSFLLTVLALAIFAGPVAAGEERLRPPVERLAHDFSDSYNRHEATAVASYFTEDGIFVAADGHVYRGRDEIKAYHQAAFDRGAKEPPAATQ